MAWDLPEGEPGEEKEFKKIDLSKAGQKLFGHEGRGPRGPAPARSGAGRAATTSPSSRCTSRCPEVFKSGPERRLRRRHRRRRDQHRQARASSSTALKIKVENAYIGKLGVKLVCLSFASGGLVRRRAVPGAGDRPGQAEAVHGVPLGQHRRPLGRRAGDRPADRVARPSSACGAACAAASSRTRARTSTSSARWCRWRRACSWRACALGVCLEPPPFQVKGGAAVSFGPSVNGKSARAHRR